jgi:hypothetical protein
MRKNFGKSWFNSSLPLLHCSDTFWHLDSSLSVTNHHICCRPFKRPFWQQTTAHPNRESLIQTVTEILFGCIFSLRQFQRAVCELLIILGGDHPHPHPKYSSKAFTQSWDTVTSFVNSNDQLADVFTKSMRDSRTSYICGKPGAFDLYAPAWGGVLYIYSILI